MDSAGGSAPWRRQGSNKSSGGSTPSAPTASLQQQQSGAPKSNYGAPPPPPPMSASGTIPSVKLNSEVGREPPSAIHGAMMKDKKPFTYTPGGIDLSEIRSPRMAKRIQMNAAAEGVTSIPQQATSSSSLSPGATPYHLPPASIAAMQPQMPIAVLPLGGFNPTNLHKTTKPNDFCPQNSGSPQFQSIPPPPPPERFSIPSPTPESRFQKSNDSHQGAASEARPIVSLASFMKQTVKPPPEDQEEVYQNRPEQKSPQPRPEQSAPQNSPMRPQVFQQRPEQVLQMHQRQEQNPRLYQRDEQKSPQIFQQRPEQTAQYNSPTYQRQEQDAQQIHQPYQREEPKSPHFFQMAPDQSAQQPSQRMYQHQQQPKPQVQQQQSQQAKAHAVSQNIGSLYIPPVEQRPSIFSDKGQLGTISGERNDSIDSESEKEKVSPQTPQLNKAPTPWMNSHNKIQATSPPFVNNSNTPWGQAKTIPISFASNDKSEMSERPQHRRVIPNSMNSIQSNHIAPTGSTSNGGRIIPIQIEASPSPSSIPHVQAGQSVIQSVRAPSLGNRTISSPMANPVSSYANSLQKQVEPSSAGSERSAGDDSPRFDPTQSKSFRVIQKITDDVDEGSSLHKTEEPRFRGSNIPSKAFHALRNQLPPSPGNQQQQQPPSYPIPVQFGPSTHTIPIRMPTQGPPSPQQYQFPVEYIGSDVPRIPASQQKITEPKIYMGKNIPSRSFKMLQQMTGEDGPSNSALGSKVGADHANNSSQSFLNPNDFCPPPPPSYQSEVGHVNSDEVSGSNSGSEGEAQYLDVPENFDLNNCDWDPNSYWYYWWYCASHFWNGTEYEFPEGWENCPVYYEENPALQTQVSMPSKAFRNLQRNFDDVAEEENEIGGDVVVESGIGPKIIIESAKNSDDSNGRLNSLNVCDKQRSFSLSSIHENEETDTESVNAKVEKEGCCEVINAETEKTDHELGTKFELSSSSESLELEFNIGMVEEPETPSSESDDSSTLVGDDSRPNTAGLMIEEYFSDDSDAALIGSKHRLSTIDEFSENEKTLSAAICSGSGKKYDSVFVDTSEDDNEIEELGSISSSEDEASSASVIENKADLQAEPSATVAKDNSSESESSEDEDDKVDELDSAVTVRLPLKLSFSKSKSYRDIATVLVGDSEIQSCANSKSESPRKADELTQDVDTVEPVVSYTVKLSKSGSQDESDNTNLYMEEILQEPHNGPETIDLENPKISKVEESDEVDFWSEIMNDRPSSQCQPNLNKEIDVVDKSSFQPDMDNTNESDSIDFWSELAKEKDDAKDLERKEINFWDKQEIQENKFNFWESHRNFELANEYHIEAICDSQVSQEESQDNDNDNIENTEVDENIENTEVNDDESSNDSEETDSTESDDEYVWPVKQLPTMSTEYDEGSKIELVPAIASGEVSDESSKSSSGGTTIGRDDTVNAEQGSGSDAEVQGNREKLADSPTIADEPTFDKEEVKPIFRQVPINVDTTTSDDNSTCTCHTKIEKMARAENLLWRIERFLQETFLLGSENDSGILTDISRQLSDYETDNDGEVEIVSSVKGKEAPELCTKAGSFTRKERLLEKVESIMKVEEKLVTFRGGTAAERRAALNYQRAKTHSRLFQLLQEECGRDDDLLEDDDEFGNHGTLETIVINESLTVVDEESTRNTSSQSQESSQQQSSTTSSSSCSSSAERSRLVPLPIKSYLTTSLSIDSNSSQSGSSGVLSPISPINRDQLLTDIINGFQQRHQQTINTHFRNKKLKNFPSKIFKVLQEEFGQEFYDAFDFGDEMFALPQLPIQINSEVYHSIQECNTTKSTTKKEESQKTCSTSTKKENKSESVTANDYDSNSIFKLDVPLDPKIKLARDLRVPKVRKN